MRYFKTIASQGEITIRRLGDVTANVPAGYSPLAPEGVHLIVGHSETGHHHVIDAARASVAVLDRPPPGMRILRAIIESPTPLVHLRDHDTHEPIMLEAGEYEIRIGREYDPYQEIARQQAD